MVTEMLFWAEKSVFCCKKVGHFQTGKQRWVPLFTVSEGVRLSPPSLSHILALNHPLAFATRTTSKHQRVKWPGLYRKLTEFLHIVVWHMRVSACLIEVTWLDSDLSPMIHVCEFKSCSLFIKWLVYPENIVMKRWGLSFQSQHCECVCVYVSMPYNPSYDNNKQHLGKRHNCLDQRST